ncbi:MAG: glycosyltransferase family 9 protein [Candidatus Eisenbacteria bacterium]|nr:glycosyltransferase family 9 protein [Candidatus Eisenbacteria bacterium]
MKAKTDCRHFIGDRPCRFGRLCEGCEHYSPMGTRILVIKLAAAGDVLRTASILPPLRRAYPDSHVTWVTDENALPLIALNPQIDRAMAFSFETCLVVTGQQFDVSICLDKEERAAALQTAVRAERKLGFGMSSEGAVVPLNAGAEYDYELGLSNEMKFNENGLSYPEIFCRTAELDYEGEAYELTLPEESLDYAQRYVRALSPGDPMVGFNVGAGPVFANKAWTENGFAALAHRVRDELGGTAVLLGGPAERAAVARIVELSDGAAIDGGVHELTDFAAIVGRMDALVTGDTMALHIAVALRVPVVAIFGPTVAQEIELYGRGRKVVSPAECAPCYRRDCDVSPSCMEAVGVDAVAEALIETLED